MLETVVLLAFVGALAVCVVSGASVLYALAAGYLIFCAYGLKKGHSARSLLSMSLTGIRTVKNIIMIFGLIGLITALWRGADYPCDCMLQRPAGISVSLSGHRISP